MSSKHQNNAVSKKDETANVPATTYDYSAYEGAGFENHTKEDYAVPLLGLLQPMSPLLEVNADAKAGMLFNTVTNELFDGKVGVVFIPAFTQHVFVEWKPREQGGGFVAVHELTSDVVNNAKAHQEFGRYKMGMTQQTNPTTGEVTWKVDPQSNDLIDTQYVYGILVKEDGGFEKIIIAFTSTKIQSYKEWMSRASNIRLKLPDGRNIVAPLFSHKYRITTFSTKNTKGTFWNLNVTFDGKKAEDCRMAPTDELVKAAIEFREAVMTDTVKMAHDTAPANAESETEEATPFK